jgi:hypothetical protein
MILPNGKCKTQVAQSDLKNNSMWNEFFRSIGLNKEAIAVSEQAPQLDPQLDAVMNDSNNRQMRPEPEQPESSDDLINELRNLPPNELKELLNKTKTVKSSEVKDAIQELIDKNGWPLKALIIENSSGGFEIKVIQHQDKITKK